VGGGARIDHQSGIRCFQLSGQRHSSFFRQMTIVRGRSVGARDASVSIGGLGWGPEPLGKGCGDSQGWGAGPVGVSARE
jgi:hypothetical protein